MHTKRFVVVLSLCSAFLFSSSIARATSIPAAGVEYYMTVQPYASGENNGQFFVGDTTIDIYADNGGSKGNLLAAYQGFCIDFEDEISVPDTYLVVAQDVGSGYIAGTSQNHLLGGPGDATLELEAALGNEFSGTSNNDTNVQEVIWNQSGAHYTYNSAMTTDYNSALAASQTSAYTGSTNDLAFEEIGGDGQSFMADLPSTTPQITSTPEPGSLFLLGTGLLGIVGVMRRRLQKTLAYPAATSL